MDGEIQFQRIRDFECQALKKLLDKERPRNEHGFGDYDDETEAKPKRTDFFTADSYNESVDLVLESIGLAKYIENFKANDVGVNILIHMDENDLAEIGITDFMDQALFKKHLHEFRGSKARAYRTVYKIEEDFIMAQNIFIHLEDINAHLNLVQHYLRRHEFEDYFVTPRKSILNIFNLVINQAFIQTKRMSDVLFDGNLDSDQLIPALLRADGLELPEFMAAKLFKPDKNFKVKTNKNKSFRKTIKTLAAFSLGFTAMMALICKCYTKK